MERNPTRILPVVTEMNDHIWRAGHDGLLHILRCQQCGYWLHPYIARCPMCRSDRVAAEPVSGRATVAGFTVNHQRWQPDVPVPYVVAIVELEERADMRLMSNLPRTPIDQVRIGLPVKVYFEPRDNGIFLPLFEAA
jgi:uncharacterized protein